MKQITRVVLMLALLGAPLLGLAKEQQPAPAEPTETAGEAQEESTLPNNSGDEVLGPLATCDVDADRQQCCSASNCGGKVLNNRDAHNCKNSGGHSWHAKNSGRCDRPRL